MLSYGEGYTGTLSLRRAMAAHFNSHFHPCAAITAEELTFTAGVTELNKVCAMVTCDPGGRDAVMMGRPIYGPFGKDMRMRAGLEFIDVGDTEQFGEECVQAYDAGYEAATARGIHIKALVICNPHNPLGRCYPYRTLLALLRFSAVRGIHLISDEIYALSTMPSPVADDREAERFTSVRAVDFTGVIDPFPTKASSSTSSRTPTPHSRFSSPSQPSMHLATAILSDLTFTAHLLATSHARLARARELAERLCQGIGVGYHRKG
ncbi:MAG: hypothetical protein Q9195_004502 [Heterodermia aff. obscurata]